SYHSAVHSAAFPAMSNASYGEAPPAQAADFHHSVVRLRINEVRLRPIDGLAEWIGAPVRLARGFLPFRLGRKAIPLPRLRTEPRAIRGRGIQLTPMTG